MILNLTVHSATIEQIDAGVIEPNSKKEIISLLTFDELPNKNEIILRATKLIQIIEEEKNHNNFDSVMLGGAPFLMSILEVLLKTKNFKPLYSFTKRVANESIIDGVIHKNSIFKHCGFVEI